MEDSVRIRDPYLGYHLRPPCIDTVAITFGRTHRLVAHQNIGLSYVYQSRQFRATSGVPQPSSIATPERRKGGECLPAIATSLSSALDLPPITFV